MGCRHALRTHSCRGAWPGSGRLAYAPSGALRHAPGRPQRGAATGSRSHGRNTWCPSRSRLQVARRELGSSGRCTASGLRAGCHGELGGFAEDRGCLLRGRDLSRFGRGGGGRTMRWTRRVVARRRTFARPDPPDHRHRNCQTLGGFSPVRRSLEDCTPVPAFRPLPPGPAKWSPTGADQRPAGHRARCASLGCS